MNWQRTARIVIAIAAVGFAVVVALAFRRRPAAVPAAGVPRTDPKAVVESASGRTLRMNRDHEEIRIDYDRLLSYADGSSKMAGVRVVTERGAGRTFTLTADQAEVADKETNVTAAGHVQVSTNDGLRLETEAATYTEADASVRAPGAVSFTRGATTGRGVGLTYDRRQDVLVLLEQVSVRMAADARGESAQVDAGTAEFNRPGRTIRFDRAVKVVRGGETTEADSAVAHLTEDEERLTALELRGHARVTPAGGASGGLQALEGRDIDITYGADGRTITRAVVTGDGVIQLAGERGRMGRRITAGTVDVTLAPDGVTPAKLAARGDVRLVLPAEGGSAARTIDADLMDGVGEPGRGLTGVHFSGNVRFLERGNGADRAGRSGVLDATLAPGGGIDDATFSRAVRFEQGDLAASAAAARYLIARDTLELSGSEPGSPQPHMDNPRLVVDATRLAVTLAGPKVTGTGSVKSVLRPSREGGGGGRAGATKVPSLFKADQPVNATADALDYDGGTSRARYSGNAQLWQGDSTIKGTSITIDDKSGNLSVASAATHTMLSQPGSKQTRAASTASGDEFVYDDALRKATYTGHARLVGPEGDLTAGRIEWFLGATGAEIERLEAYDDVTLKEQNRRKTTGKRLTYLSAEERYVVAGTPVTAVDQCGRETTGRTLTFYRTADRIVVDGNEQVRTQTKGASSCP